MDLAGTRAAVSRCCNRCWVSTRRVTGPTSNTVAQIATAAAMPRPGLRQIVPGLPREENKPSSEMTTSSHNEPMTSRSVLSSEGQTIRRAVASNSMAKKTFTPSFHAQVRRRSVPIPLPIASRGNPSPTLITNSATTTVIPPSAGARKASSDIIRVVVWAPTASADSVPIPATTR